MNSLANGKLITAATLDRMLEARLNARGLEANPPAQPPRRSPWQGSGWNPDTFPVVPVYFTYVETNKF